MESLKICKCGHSKDTHKKNPSSRWSSATHCRDCACNDYLNRERPNRNDKIIIGICVSLIISLLFTTTVLLDEVKPTEENRDNVIKFTYEGLYEILVLVMLVITLFFISWLVIDPLFEYYRMKKRPNYDIK